MKKEKKEKKVILKSEKVKKRERFIKILRLALLILAIILVCTYLVLRIMFQPGAFTVMLDRNLAKDTGIVLLESLNDTTNKMQLKAQELPSMDNISVNWIPNNVDDMGGGSHNGTNYFAYTFYAKNEGVETVGYYYSIVIDAIVKNVDTAIRVRVYHNGTATTYAKLADNGTPEPGTTPFYSDEYVCLNERTNFNVGEADRFTVIIWIEGDDPDCTNALIGGEMQMHFELTSEHQTQ